MENNYNTESLEAFLRRTTDTFRMYPKTHKWTSLYNNLHPSKKWPSVTSCLLILVCMMAITNSDPANELNKKQKNESGFNHTEAGENKFPFDGNHLFTKYIVPANPINQPYQFRNLTSNNSSILHQKNKKTSTGITTNQSPFYVKHSSPFFKVSYNASAELFDLTGSAKHNATSNLRNQDPAFFTKHLSYTTIPNTKNNEWSNQYKENVKTSPLAFQIYATPSFGYRNVSRSTQETRSVASAFNSEDGTEHTSFNEENILHQSPSWNIEAGGAFLLNINKEVRIKAGMQLNYSRYKGMSAENEVNDNTGLLSSTEQGLLMDHTAEIQGSVTKWIDTHAPNGSTYEISLPVGTEFKLAGNDQLQWYAGATVQPSFIISDDANIASSNMKSLVQDYAVLRKWNVNTSVETFLSYKLKNGAVLNAGPQLRYQLMSSYDSKYYLNEKLYNIGIKLGVTRSF